MMATFTPPSIAEVSPIGPGDRFGNRLFRYFQARQRGVAVFKMSDGTYQLARAVPGLNLTVAEPYPATTPDQYPQTAKPPSVNTDGAGSVQGEMLIATSMDGTTQTYTTYPAQQPQVALIYYGGHVYTVSSAEAARLTAAGLGAYIGPDAPVGWGVEEWNQAEWH